LVTFGIGIRIDHRHCSYKVSVSISHRLVAPPSDPTAGAYHTGLSWFTSDGLSWFKPKKMQLFFGFFFFLHLDVGQRDFAAAVLLPHAAAALPAAVLRQSAAVELQHMLSSLVSP
jgi:hypothetical protein